MTTLELPTLTIVPLAGAIGAEVHGLQVGNLSDADFASVKDALYTHHVLFFPGQGTDPAIHRAFSQHFGEIVYPHEHLANLGDAGYREISVISTDNGSAYQANRWHCDVAWRAAPSRFSVLHMQVLPEAGGDTLWSNQYAALDALSAPIREALYGLTATHRIAPQPGVPEASHPLVIRHPETGREALFVNDLFTARINELSDDESSALLGLLKSVSIRPEFTVRRRWSVGDIAIWDNHFVQHNAIYDYGDAPRRIHRIEVAPEAPVPAR
ncbi:TauD/TfdA dioxygenase family protein [Rhodococcus sp. NPDC003348]